MLAALLALVLAAPPPDAPPPAPAPAQASAPATGGWRSTRFGMSAEQVLAALPGEAVRIVPPVKLADGNTIEAGIDGHPFEGLSFDVRFVFTGGKLALVSLRTPQRSPVDATAYVRLRDSLARQWGAPIEETKDDAFIDMRQARWSLDGGRADLKYIPGVVALVFYPWPAPAPRTPQ